MGQPNSSFDEYAVMTIGNYSKDLRDNVTNHIPLWHFMDEAGAVVTEDGGLFLAEALDYGDNASFTWFSGYDEVSTTPTDAFSQANFDWKEANANIIFNEREKAINSGVNQRYDLVKKRTINCEKTIRNNLGASLYYVGTESDGKAVAGLQYIVADDPTTGIVGNINRATAGNEFWRNQVFDESVDAITLSSTTIQDAMELLWIRCTRGLDTPNLIPFGNTFWRFYAKSIGDQQRYVKSGVADSKAHTSFEHYMFKTAKVFNDPNCLATRGYMLNTEYLKIKAHESRNISVDKPRYPAGQRATVIPVDFMGNVVCGNASLQGVFHS